MSKRSDLKAVVAERGQVTIPKSIRDRLGIGPGAVVVFELRDRKIIVTKEIQADPIALVTGCLKGVCGYTSTDDLMNDIRGGAE